MSKNCNICKINKSLDKFHKSKFGKKGTHPSCKNCRSIQRKQIYVEKPISGFFKCSMCKKSLHVSNFHADKSSLRGIQSQCRDCHKKKMIVYYSKNTEEKFWTKLWKDLKRNATKRNIDVYITKEDIINCFNNQNGYCALSGEKLATEFIPYKGRGNRPTNASVDRIDSNKSYNKDNIQIVSSLINTIKWDMSMAQFHYICKKVVDHIN